MRVTLLLGTNVSTIYVAKELYDKGLLTAVIQQDDRFPFDLEGGYFDRGLLNSKNGIDCVSRTHPDILISYGPEKICKEIISIPRLGGFNVHWGLSPMYRGMHTSRWALVHGKPEYVGLTIHMLDENLDTGDIIYQARPNMQIGDDYRSIEHRLSLLAGEIIPQVIVEMSYGVLKTTEQDLSIGRQYWAREWTSREEKLCSTSRIIDLLDEYNQNKEERDIKVPLINPWYRK